jgi:hypothetical protein
VLLLELAQRLLHHALPLERGPGLDENRQLLLKLAFCLLECDTLLRSCSSAVVSATAFSARAVFSPSVSSRAARPR